MRKRILAREPAERVGAAVDDLETVDERRTPVRAIRAIRDGQEDLDLESLIQILTEPKNALAKQYARMFEMDNVELVFTPDALEAALDREPDAMAVMLVVALIGMPLVLAYTAFVYEGPLWPRRIVRGLATDA